MFIELEAGGATATLDPVAGGRVAQLNVRGRDVLVDRHQTSRGSDPIQWGSYPMVPWAGRLADGRFPVSNGHVEQLPQNLAPHAIHGLVFDTSWDVIAVGATTATIECLIPWRLGGAVRQHVTLTPQQLRCDITVTATHTAFPCVVGWHPWFAKPRAADVNFAQQYERGDNGLPTGRLITPVAHPWDDCFVEPTAPLRLRYDELTVTVESDCDHWVVFDVPAHATCIEPQSGPPNFPNLSDISWRPDVVDRDHSMSRWMTISW